MSKYELKQLELKNKPVQFRYLNFKCQVLFAYFIYKRLWGLSSLGSVVFWLVLSSQSWKKNPQIDFSCQNSILYKMLFLG